MTLLFWSSVFVLFYVYFGYPLLLLLLRRIKGKRLVRKNGFIPDVTLIISAYNEADSIQQKIENSLSLNYPPEKLEILVVSDASTDKTDQIVSKYRDRGVTLVRMNERNGKTFGLNHTVPIARGKIIVFSDANAFYEPDSILRLAQNFSDPEVGYVTGASRYVQKKQSFVGLCENLYWDYDLKIKQIESDLGSMVGADGAMYAIRRELYTPLKSDDINDFLNPLQIIRKGFRGIFEPEAICRETTVSRFGEEYRRKVRIVSRSLHSLKQVAVLLNPVHFGLYAIQLFSHKLLRWLTPIFILGIALSNIALWPEGGIYHWIGAAQIICYSLALAGFIFSSLGIRLKLFFLPYYFCLMNLASIHAIWKSARGNVQSTWEPERTKPQIAENRREVFMGFFVVLIGIAVFISTFSIFSQGVSIQEKLFFLMIALLSYTVVGYIATLALVARIIKPLRTPMEEDPNFLPSVTLLISAYNEENVIESKIVNSLELDYPTDHFRIVLVSDGSTDRTNQIAESYTDQGLILWKYHPRHGKISVINRAMARIETEIVVFSDANVLYDPDAVRSLVKHFKNPDVGAVSGSVSVSDTPTRLGLMEFIYQKYENYIKEKETIIGSITGVDGAMYAIRKDIYRQVGEHIILDDLVISMNVARCRKRILFEPDAKGVEHAAMTVKEIFGTRVRVIAGAIQAIRQHLAFPPISQPFLLFKFISHKILRWFLPLLLIVFFFLNCLLIDQKIYLMLFFIHAGFYGLSFIGFLTKSSLPIFSIPFYFSMQNMATIVGICRGLRDKQSVKWEKSDRYPLQHKDRNVLSKKSNQPSI